MKPTFPDLITLFEQFDQAFGEVLARDDGSFGNFHATIEVDHDAAVRYATLLAEHFPYFYTQEYVTVGFGPMGPFIKLPLMSDGDIAGHIVATIPEPTASSILNDVEAKLKAMFSTEGGQP